MSGEENPPRTGSWSSGSSLTYLGKGIEMRDLTNRRILRFETLELSKKARTLGEDHKSLASLGEETSTH